MTDRYAEMRRMVAEFESGFAMPDPTVAAGGPVSEPRYARTDDGTAYCEDCGLAVVEKRAHTRFHSILASHGWTLAVLQNTHLSATTHERYDAVERIKRRTFDNWSAAALAEVMAESDGAE